MFIASHNPSLNRQQVIVSFDQGMLKFYTSDEHAFLTHTNVEIVAVADNKMQHTYEG